MTTLLTLIGARQLLEVAHQLREKRDEWGFCRVYTIIEKCSLRAIGKGIQCQLFLRVPSLDGR